MQTDQAFADLNPITSAAYTASGDSGILTGAGTIAMMRAFLVCTAVSGTNPTLDVVLEDSPDGSTWFNVATFARLTAAGSQALDITKAFAQRWHVKYTIGGSNTPTFTFGVWVMAK